jgi:hypothetical protein
MDASSQEFAQALESFRSLLDRQVVGKLQPSGPTAVYTPLVTAWLLVYQRLHAGCSLADAVSELVQSNPSFLPNNRRVRERTLSSNTGAYSRARQRLRVDLAERLAQHVYQSLVAATPPSLHGRRAFILDGTTITLAPTAALKQAFPPSTNQHGQSAWPVALLLVAHELESGCAILPEVGAMYGAEAVGEVSLTKRLLPRLPANSLLIADRNFWRLCGGLWSSATRTRGAAASEPRSFPSVGSPSNAGTFQRVTSSLAVTVDPQRARSPRALRIIKFGLPAS